MELVHWFVDIVLHLDKHLVELLTQYGIWIYAILFVIVFAETGLVVTPFLPGDSLLFAVGALAAVDTSGTLTAPVALGLLFVAAVLGNTTNYSIGRAIGPPAFSGRYRLLKVEYLRQTEDFFAKHGGMTIVLSRFLPIFRTFAPFVAGAAAWTTIFLGGGYLFGNLPIVKNNFGVVTILIIVVSLLPLAWAFLKRRSETGRAGA